MVHHKWGERLLFKPRSQWLLVITALAMLVPAVDIVQTVIEKRIEQRTTSDAEPKNDEPPRALWGGS